MDYIREFDIRLEKEMYYAGEALSGVVVLDTSENFKVRAIRVLLRGKAHTEWKVMVSGEKRTVQDDQYFIDDRVVIWGKGDVMESIYLRPVRGETKRRRCCLCCESEKVSLRTDFERSAYVCGESLRVRADIDNQSEEQVRLKLRLLQFVEYYIDRGVLGVQKEVSNTILEYRGAPVEPHTRTKWDSQQNLVLPTLPPTLVGVCRLIQIYYVLKVNAELEKSGEDLQMHFPITVATVPFRIPNSNQMPVLTYEVACDHCEGGSYIGPEFLLGQVYDGTTEFCESIVLYRPVYSTTRSKGNLAKTSSINNSIQSQPQTPNVTKGLKVVHDLPSEGGKGPGEPGPSSMSKTIPTTTTATAISSSSSSTIIKSGESKSVNKSLGKDNSKSFPSGTSTTTNNNASYTTTTTTTPHTSTSTTIPSVHKLKTASVSESGESSANHNSTTSHSTSTATSAKSFNKLGESSGASCSKGAAATATKQLSGGGGGKTKVLTKKVTKTVDPIEVEVELAEQKDKAKGRVKGSSKGGGGAYPGKAIKLDTAEKDERQGK